MTDEARRARQALGAHDRGARAIRELCGDRLGHAGKIFCRN